MCEGHSAMEVVQGELEVMVEGSGSDAQGLTGFEVRWCWGGSVEGLSLHQAGEEKEERPGNQCQGLLAGSHRNVEWDWEGSTTAGSGCMVEDALLCPLGL